MNNIPKHKEKMNLRKDHREEGLENASVEFLPGNKELTYQFKLRDFSLKGFGIIVRKDSRVLQHIKTGDVLDMTYYPDEIMSRPVQHRTQIKHITEPDPGKHQDHLLVGLLIID